METKDLVRRVDDPNDRRAKRIFLTSGAHKLKPDMEEIAEKFRQQARQDLMPKDIATSARVLKKMRENVMRIKQEAQAGP